MSFPRCAGGAGTFIVKDYETSQKIFARKARAVEQSGADVVATSCPACMIRLKTGLQEGVEVKHVAQMLHEVMMEEHRATLRPVVASAEQEMSSDMNTNQGADNVGNNQQPNP